VATTISQVPATGEEAPPPAAGGPPARPPLVDARVRNLDVVRRFVERIVDGGGGEPLVELSREEWDAVWSAGSDQETIQGAIARVVFAARAVRGGGPRRDDGPVAPPSVPPALGPTVPLALDRWTPRSALDDPAFTALFRVRPSGTATGGVPVTVPTVGPTTVAPPVADRAPVAPALTVGFFDLLPGFPGAVREAAPEPAPAPAPAPATATARSRAEERRRLRLLSASNWVRNIGALMILFAAWQVWGTAIAQHHTQQALGHEFSARVHAAPPPVPVGDGLVPASVRLTDPPEGTVEAHIQIPEIGVDQYVVAGTAADDLAKGPGHYIGTAMPGQEGNVAIAGHRTTHGAPFNHLDELAVGDPIYLTTSTGQRLTYLVAQTPYPVSPSDVSVLNNFGDNRLTLTTCNPKFSAAQRLIVVAEYQVPGVPQPAKPVVATGKGTPYRHVKNAGESGWNVGVLPLVLLEGAFLVLLGLFTARLARLYGRAGRWLILAPVWVAGIYALFQTLTTFLPAAA